MKLTRFWTIPCRDPPTCLAPSPTFRSGVTADCAGKESSVLGKNCGHGPQLSWKPAVDFSHGGLASLKIRPCLTSEQAIMFRDLWGTCTLPIPAPHRDIARRSEGPLLYLLTGHWVPASLITTNCLLDVDEVWPHRRKGPREEARLCAEPQRSNRLRPNTVATDSVL
jgi:hypothetical protein